MINHGDLWCPLCQSADLRCTYIPASIRYYTFDEEEVHDHFGESCDIECKSCGFQFNYHTEQEA